MTLKFGVTASYLSDPDERGHGCPLWLVVTGNFGIERRHTVVLSLVVLIFLHLF